MTQDYKDTLLKYLTNNLTETTPTNVKPEFTTPTLVVDTTIQTLLDTEFPYGYMEKGSLRCKDGKGNYNGKTLVYGNYYTTSAQSWNDAKGFLILLDEEYNLLELIKKYNSGTDLSRFLVLQIDEEGNFYGQDYTLAGNYRFIMLSNVSIKSEIAEHYTVKLRQSYNMDGHGVSYPSGFTYYAAKSPNSATYLIWGTGMGVLLKINVGSPNEWTEIDGNSSYGSEIDTKATWDSNDNLSISLYAYDSTNNKLVHGILSGTNISYSDYITNLKSALFGDYMQDYGFTLLNNSQTIVFVERKRTFGIYQNNANDFYLVAGGYVEYNEQITDTNCVVRCFHVVNQNITKVFSYEYPNENTAEPKMYNVLQSINGTICNINMTCTDDTDYNVQAELITNDIDIYAIKNYSSFPKAYLQKFKVFQIQNLYNLYKFYGLSYNSEAANYVKTNTNIVYNSNNYNGDPYIDTNTLNPKQALLYDEDDKLVYARNLYNKTLYNNTLQATVEIPNTILNDITISKQNLLGETNYVLVSNEDDIEKNIYETLYINFFNTLLIQNRNTDDYINNIPGSSRLNDSVSNTNDYDDATLTKAKVNYTDGTSEIIETTNTITDGVCSIAFSIFPKVDIINIELISEDEDTVYQTIDGKQFTILNIYNIVQHCYVE